jgi:hypothetical protein
MALRGLPIVFDFDDAIFLRYKSPSNGYWSYLKFPGKTAKLCRLARQVMAGNEYLASYASRFNNEVTVVPTTIDVELYRPSLPRAATGLPTVGWTGSHSTARHLRTIVPALEELARHRRSDCWWWSAPSHPSSAASRSKPVPGERRAKLRI